MTGFAVALTAAALFELLVSLIAMILAKQIRAQDLLLMAIVLLLGAISFHLAAITWALTEQTR